MTQTENNPNPEALSLALLGETLVANAASAALKGERLRAVEILESLHKSVSPSASSLALLGKIQAQEGDYKAAIEAWESALGLLRESSTERVALQESIRMAERMDSRPQDLTAWRGYRAAFAVMFFITTASIVVAVNAANGALRQSREIARLQTSLAQISRQQEARFIAHQAQTKELQGAALSDMHRTWENYEASGRERDILIRQEMLAERKKRDAEMARLLSMAEAQSDAVRALSARLAPASQKPPKRP